jgi:hypothetical protein
MVYFYVQAFMLMEGVVCRVCFSGHWGVWESILGSARSLCYWGGGEFWLVVRSKPPNYSGNKCMRPKPVLLTRFVCALNLVVCTLSLVSFVADITSVSLSLL